MFFVQGSNMAGELWNRVHVPRPGAISVVRVHFDSNTDAKVKSLLVETGRVLKLIRSEILQTEIRVLYGLLYILNNSFRGNKTFKGLQQVEQCINRLKSMKLDVALQELTELCPNRIQRGLSIKAGECDVPSQPMLEWFCLKVLGAAQLMSCTLSRCTRAFTLSRQQMKWEEFVILNLVITSMLSRLWVIFRGVLVSLSTLYQQLLKFHSEVARAQHMPFLKDFTLPADITEFLGPSGAVFLTKKSANIPHASDNKEKQTRRRKPSVKVKNQQRTKKLKEDFGVAVERGSVHDTDLKPFLKVFRNFTQGKSFREETNRTDKKKKFNKQVREASSFTDLATHLDEMITWCKSHKMEKEKRFLTFLRLKCQRMKCLEAAGYKFQRKLKTFRQEAHWALLPQGSVPRTCRSFAALRTNTRQRTCFHSIRSRFKSSALRAGVKEKRLKREKKRTELPRNKTTYQATSQATNCDNHDDIDDIFASIGL